MSGSGERLRSLAAKAKSPAIQRDYRELASEWDIMAEQIEMLRRDQVTSGTQRVSVEFGPHLRPNTRFQAQPSDCTNFVVVVYKPSRFSADPRCSIPKLTEFGKFAGPE
jgi:hypothetical protein